MIKKLFIFIFVMGLLSCSFLTEEPKSDDSNDEDNNYGELTVMVQTYFSSIKNAAEPLGMFNYPTTNNEIQLISSCVSFNLRATLFGSNKNYTSNAFIDYGLKEVMDNGNGYSVQNSYLFNFLDIPLASYNLKIEDYDDLKVSFWRQDLIPSRKLIFNFIDMPQSVNIEIQPGENIVYLYLYKFEYSHED